MKRTRKCAEQGGGPIFLSREGFGTNCVIMIQPNPCLFEAKEKKATGFGLVLLPSLPAPGTDSVRTVPPRLREQRGELLFGCHLQLDDNIVSYHFPVKSNAILCTQLHKVPQHFQGTSSLLSYNVNLIDSNPMGHLLDFVSYSNFPEIQIPGPLCIVKVSPKTWQE